jgi:hypothetical protein
MTSREFRSLHDPVASMPRSRVNAGVSRHGNTGDASVDAGDRRAKRAADRGAQGDLQSICGIGRALALKAAVMLSTDLHSDAASDR